jgi:hypothetical protein
MDLVLIFRPIIILADADGVYPFATEERADERVTTS